MNLRLLSDAEDEIREAMLRYEARQRGLGMRFLECVQQTALLVGRDPRRFPLYEGKRLRRPFRRARVTKFPYILVFEMR